MSTSPVKQSGRRARRSRLAATIRNSFATIGPAAIALLMVILRAHPHLCQRPDPSAAAWVVVLVPVTVKVPEPVAVDDAVTVRVELPPAVTVAGLNAPVTPLGRPASSIS